MHILVIRTSAMGDVALVSPVLREMRKKFPEVKITLLTRPAFNSFFTQSDSLSIFPLDSVKRHKGLIGLFRLYRDIKQERSIDRVIDLHDVIRSKILSFFFRLNGVPVSVIDKGRREKHDLIKGKRKVQLKHTVIRYSDTFAKAGFILDPSDKINIVPAVTALNLAGEIFNPDNILNIGVAPYAKHKLKMWPEENMIRLLNMISDKRNVKFFLFGGGEESDLLDKFIKKVKGCTNLAGKLSLEKEIDVISRLDFMIAMDSSNMHMAALCGIKVISIWGGTDPISGFGAWMQPENYSMGIPSDELKCRPCTIYGKGECRRGDLACINRLTTEKVFKKLNELKLL